VARLKHWVLVRGQHHVTVVVVRVVDHLLRHK